MRTLAASVEAAERALQELGDQAQATHGEVEKLHTQFTDLSDLFQKVDDLQAFVQGSIQHIEEMEHEAEQTATDLKASLEGFVSELHNQLASVEHDFAECENLLHHIQQDAHEVQQSREKHAQDLHHEAEAVDAAFGEAEEAVEQEQGESEQSIQGLTEGTTDFETELEQAVSDLNEALEQFEERCDESLKEIESAFQDLQHSLDQQKSEALQAVERHQEEATSKVHDSLLNQTVPELEQHANGLGEGIASVAEFLEGPLHALDGKVGDIVDGLDKALDLYRTIKPILDMCEHIPL